MMRPLILLSALLTAFLAACGDSSEEPEPNPSADAVDTSDTSEGEGETEGGEEHAHEEDPLGTVEIDGMKVELAQGHGAVTPGKEAHLVVKLPYSDQGATVVRAWIGTEDRTESYVGKGEYAPSHDDYDIHATAPDPLPDNPLWWIEIEKPDGTKAVGSAKPLME